ncbi:MAG: LysR family transcriptional regulator [Proteobacteria bacterium]|nr:LysR family transcriptional regulator [Pseudomonadota bacterium]MCH9757527.1 LysR family transcriptional regulator [Pseudomonadota bacterium]
MAKKKSPSTPRIKLSQLRTLVAICDNDLNVTAAAQQLNIAQPSMSKKLSTLEQAIGKSLFYRNGKRFQYETDLCREVSKLAREILLKCDNLLMLGETFDQTTISGELSIGTTHTQARYVLPQVLEKFRKDYPDVVISIRQGAPVELVRMLNSNQLDFVICTEALETNTNFRTMTSFNWNRCLLLPPTHPLVKVRKITLTALAKYPLVTYTQGFAGRPAFDNTFSTAGIIPKIMVSATDADVIKTYVRLGFGIGVVAEMAYDAKKDADLVMRPLEALFPAMQVRLAYQREKFISASMQRFIELFCQIADKPDKPLTND